MFSKYTDKNLDIIRYIVVIKHNQTQFELQCDKKNSLQYTKTLKNSDKLTKNDVKVVRNKMMHYNIQYDASQVEVLDETQINIYIRIYIYEYI